MNLYFVLFLGLMLSGCDLQTENSVSHDKERFGEEENSPLTSESSSEFKQVVSILNARCASCHPTYPNYSEQQWITNGYVNPGSARTSLLYSRLRGAGAGGKENMPQDGPLAPSEVALFYNWIQRIISVR